MNQEASPTWIRRSTLAGKNGTAVDRGLDRRTVNYVHAILHGALKDAVRWGRLARNPADPPRAGQKSDGIHTWDAATLRRFLGASQAAEDRLMVCGFSSRPPACAGARPSA